MRSLLPILLLAACVPSDPAARGIELEIGDTAAAASGDYHRVPLRLSRSRSAFAPGLFLQADLYRPSGARGRLVLDLPEPGSAQTAAPTVTYAEHDAGGRVLFQSARATGRIELSADPACPCQTGRLELLFADPGLDGALGTADDRVRRLGSARLRLDGRPFCHGRAPLAIREELLVVGSRACPVKGGGGGGAGSSVAWSIGLDLAVERVFGWNQDGWYDEGWCGDYDEGGKGDEGDDGWEDGWTDGYGHGDDGYRDDGYRDDGSHDDGSHDDGWSNDGYRDDGWSDDGWSDDGYRDDGYRDDGWSDDGWSDDSGDDWSDSSDDWDDDSWGTDDEWDDGSEDDDW
jgi:hypothetical protein